MKNGSWLGVMLGALGVLVTPSVMAEQPLAQEEVEWLRTNLKPGSEAWRDVGWNPSLIDAQSIAVEKKRPLLIWAMDGHPLSCV